MSGTERSVADHHRINGVTDPLYHLIHGFIDALHHLYTIGKPRIALP